jgi:flagellar motor switch protein FliN
MGDETNRLDLDELTETETPPADQNDAAPAATSPGESAPRPPGAAKGDDLGAVYDIPVQLSAVLGKTTLPVSQLLRLGRGAVVELDRKVGEPIDILVNNRLVARGEVVILDDRLGVTMTEIIKTET